MHHKQLHVTAMVRARWSSFEYKHGEKKHVIYKHEIAQRSCLVGHLFCFTCIIIKKSRGSIQDWPCCCQKHIQYFLRAATAAARSCDRCQENQRQSQTEGHREHFKITDPHLALPFLWFPVVSSLSKMPLCPLCIGSTYNTACSKNMHLNVGGKKRAGKKKKNINPHILFCNHVRGDRFHNNPSSYNFTCSAKRYVLWPSVDYGVQKAPTHPLTEKGALTQYLLKVIHCGQFYLISSKETIDPLVPGGRTYLQVCLTFQLGTLACQH